MGANQLTPVGQLCEGGQQAKPESLKPDVELSSTAVYVLTTTEAMDSEQASLVPPGNQDVAISATNLGQTPTALGDSHKDTIIGPRPKVTAITLQANLLLASACGGFSESCGTSFDPKVQLADEESLSQTGVVSDNPTKESESESFLLYPVVTSLQRELESRQTFLQSLIWILLFY